MKIKIIHLIPEINLTCGISKSVLNIIDNSKHVFEHQIFTFGGDAVDLFNKNGLIITNLNQKKSICSYINLIIILLKKHECNHLCIIHSHHRIFDLISKIVSKYKNYKTITTVHSIVFGRKALSYYSPNIIAVSNSVKMHLVNHFNIDKSRIKVINNFITENKLNPIKESSINNKFEFEDYERIILFIGRFDKEKGVDLLVEAISKISDEYNNLVLLLVGNGKLNNWLKDYAKKSNAKIIIANPTVDVKLLYDLAEIVVLPSRVDPFPLSMLEAGFYKKAFVGANVDGISELIENKKDGLLFDKENINELISSITKLLNSKTLRENLSKNLNRKVNNGFLHQSIIPKYIDYYKNVK